MKEIILAGLILLALVSASFSQTNPDNPEYSKGPQDTKSENSTIKNNCRDICLEKDEHGTCIKVEVQCEN